MNTKPARFSIVRFFSSFKGYRQFKALSADQRNIVFYSESGQDWHHFKPIVTKLLEQSHQVCYLTSDANDSGLLLKHPLYSSVCVPMGFWLITLFQFMKADCCVLTMIDLHVFHLKRSIHPVHYIYLFHSMSSTHMVDFENSYDHYDTILCVGQHQIDEVRAREKLKDLPPKNLVHHGYARIDTLLQDPRNNHRSPQAPYTILLAPTWGPDSILPVCGDALIGILLDAGFKVILRPHYQTTKLMPEIVNALLKSYSEKNGFSYINAMGDTDSLFASDMLICDWSSTSMEYALGLEKPVLYIDVPKRIRNPHYTDLNMEPLEISIRSVVGNILSPNALEKAPEVINQLLSDPEKFRKKIATLRNQVLFNSGKSVEVGAREIAGIASDIRDKRLSTP